MPRVSWVRSFDPIEKPSKCSRNSSASITLAGISHIRFTLRPFSPRRRPCSAMRSSTRRPSWGVRTNGNISCTFVRPMSSRTRRIAAHSSAKQSAKEDEG